MAKRTFTLLELLISLALIALIVPLLISQPFKTMGKQIEDLQSQLLANDAIGALADAYVRLHQEVIPPEFLQRKKWSLQSPWHEDLVEIKLSDKVARSYIRKIYLWGTGHTNKERPQLLHIQVCYFPKQTRKLSKKALIFFSKIEVALDEENT